MSFIRRFVLTDVCVFLLLILKALLPGVQVFTVMYPPHPMLNQGEPFLPAVQADLLYQGYVVYCMIHTF